MANPFRELFGGTAVLIRGAGLVLRRPRLFLLGAVPPLVTSVLFLALLILLLVNIADLAVAMSPFADGWQPVWRGVLRAALGLAVVVGAVVVMVVGFTTATLALGSPIYDKIAEAAEEEFADAPPEAPEARLGAVLRTVRQSLAVVLVSLLVSAAVLATGFIPFVGQIIAPVLSALLGGWVLTVELVGNAFDRRGLRRLKDRHAAMRQHRLRVLGFAVPVFLLLAVPFLAVAVFPAAAAGGTLLTRQLLPAGRGTHPRAAPGPWPPGFTGQNPG